MTPNNGADSNGSVDKEEKPTAASPSITLPKGGGAIRGIGEKFSVNPATGTGSFSIPFPLSPGRAGFTPQLNLSYDSGSGNGTFGFGWSISAASITRKTDKGIPRYDDGGESDVFILSGAEDLVPVLDANGQRVRNRRNVWGNNFEICNYRPRIEGLFSHIERWINLDTGESHWRTITRDNVTSLFGSDASGRVSDPADLRRVFSYKLQRSWDDKGNIAVYCYIAEDSSGVQLGQANEANRTDAIRATQRYLKSIYYGNTTPCFPDSTAGRKGQELPQDWLFKVVFDYGDHDLNSPAATPSQPWSIRPDPFSNHRSSFEVRTYRRVQRVLMFHNFPNEKGVGADALVRSMDFCYSDQLTSPDPQGPIYTFLVSVKETGYRPNQNGWFKDSLPPVEFEYSQAKIQGEVLSLHRDSLNGLPEGVDGSRFQWVDLDGEGLSGVLTDEGGGWGYKRNLSPVHRVKQPDGTLATRGRFGPLESVAALPSRSGLSSGQQFLDLSGGGKLDLVDFNAPSPGFFKRTDDEDWEPFQRFGRLPDINWAEPNLKFVDVTGDGLTDVLFTEDGLFTYYQSLGECGFAPARMVRTPMDENRGPKVVAADGTQTIFLADMSGDGLSDIVRVRNGEVCYWPNLGYGHFGPKVTMDNAPRFTDEERFDPRRVRLADIDGSGTTDVLYLGEERIWACFNQSGNSWAAPVTVGVMPSADSLSAVQLTDLLGNGTACLVWSCPLPAAAASPLRYIDLMGGQKPHLLTRIVNNLGAETRLTYAPSTRFYLADKFSGHPWVTKLPHVVQVVERMESIDWIGRNRGVSRYAYHHGYFDGYEREFRGFGMVEQWDTEEFNESQFTDGDAINWSKASWSPPAHTKTWFHTGAFEPAIAVTQQYQSEYWCEPGGQPTVLPDTILPNGLDGQNGPPFLNPFEVREAYRALKGSVLRTEVYADDGSSESADPYSVTERNFTISWLQPMGVNQHAVFFVHPREEISLHYERNASDPRVTHDFTLEVDDYGNVLHSVSVGYPRRAGYQPPEPTLSASFQGMLAYDQERLHVRAAQNQFTNALDDSVNAPDIYRSPQPAATTVAELTGVSYTNGLFTFDAVAALWQAAWDGTHDVPYEGIPRADVDGAAQPSAELARRIINQTCTLYRSDDLTALLPLGTLQSLALPGQSYQAVLTPGQITAIFGALAPPGLPAEGGYVPLTGQTGWWAPSGRVYYSSGTSDSPAMELAQARAHFFLQRRVTDPFGSVTTVDYDGYDLLPAQVTDPLNNVTSAVYDYRALQPALVTDPNENQSAAAFDCHGQVTATAVMGKAGQNVGDSLSGFTTDLDETAIAQFFAEPLSNPAAALGNATTRVLYDRSAFYRTRSAAQPLPPGVYILSRQTHVSDLNGGVTLYQHAFSYSDGFGREIQKKAQAKAGPLVDGGPTVDPRWVGSGWVIFNNKGQAIQKYEPFFTTTNVFEFAAQIGVSSTLFYDPVGRTVATLHPDNTWEKAVFDCWKQETWDGNDTVLIADPRQDADVGTFFSRWFGHASNAFTLWYALRITGTYGTNAADQAAQKDAAQKASAHAGTPTVAHFDALGRTCLTVQDNGGGVRYPSRVALDTEGKPLAVIDAKDRRVMEYLLRVTQGGSLAYSAGNDMLGRQIYQNSMDAGARRTFLDIQGKPIRRWDARGHAFRTTYDTLRRPLQMFVIGSDQVNSDPRTIPSTPGQETMYEWFQYGDGADFPGTLNAFNMNVRTRIWRHWDCAGRLENSQFDFKGNLASSTRTLISAYKSLPDWSVTNPAPDTLLDPETFSSSTTYDALNRPLTLTTPDSSIIRHTFSASGLLDTVDVNQRGAVDTNNQPVWTAFVTGIDHNPKGQRASISYQNGAATAYTYDAQTFRLTRLYTTRPPRLNGVAGKLFTNSGVVQDLNYAYDPVGNITRIRDDALVTLYYNQQEVDPLSDYTYDPIYRLIVAMGREHIGQTAFAPDPQTGDLRDYPFVGLANPNPNDLQAMRNYTENYAYDEVGNFNSVQHVALNGGWNRGYAYSEPSLIEPALFNNRLSNTTVGSGSQQNYQYDAHGSMQVMPHLPAMAWDFKEQLFMTQQQQVSPGASAPKTYYLYDASGQRVFKVTESGTKSDARYYLGGYEIYREYGTDGISITLERDSLHVMDDKRRVALVETTTTVPPALSTVAPAPPSAPVTLIRFQHDNHLESASLELDETAALISYEEYYPYGTSSFQAAGSQTEVAKRYRYIGKERDEESGFYYHGARYYAPWLGRWTSADPWSIKAGCNLYDYASNNPVKLRDSDGRQPEGIQPTQTNLERFVARVHAGGQSSAQDVFREILHETADHLGATQFGGWVKKIDGKDVPAETADSGFRPALQDPWVQSRFQVGHFLTAVSHALNGIDPQSRTAILLSQATRGTPVLSNAYEDVAKKLFGWKVPSVEPWQIDIGPGKAGSLLGPLWSKWLGVNPENRAFSIWVDVGHEAKSDAEGPAQQIGTLSARDIADFQSAVASISQDPNATVDLDQLSAKLARLAARLGLGFTAQEGRQGNSFQDLLLTAMGYGFADMLQGGKFANADQAAAWIQRNLGTARSAIDQVASQENHRPIKQEHSSP